MQEIRVGTATSMSSGNVKGSLTIGHMPDGSPMASPVIIARGASEGPTLWLHGCVHGNEYCGTFVIHELIRSLDPAEMAGTVVALPLLNITACHADRRMSPFEGYGNGDLNRCFPGSADGALTDQMAHAIFQPLKACADVLIDFHTALTYETRWSLFPDMGGRVGEVGRGIARAFGFTYLPAAPDILGGLLTGSSMMAAGREGIPSFIVEIGGKGPAFDDGLVADGVARMRNVMRYLRMLPGEVEVHRPQRELSTYDWLHAERGGLFMPLARCCDLVEQGQVLGRFYDVFGRPSAELRSPCDGEILAIHGGPSMPAGDTVLQIGLDPREVT